MNKRRLHIECDPDTADALTDFQRKSQQNRRRFFAQQPTKISDVMADLVQRRGYAREQTAAVWETAWRQAAGERWEGLVRLGKCRRGVLEVRVINSLVMQELGFDKQRIIDALNQQLPRPEVKQLRFRIGL
ncbi:MAG: DUF721 domain-containing protein [Planctomycetales bacterium]|nr:DUF721 domain-containing protein [Planctomycetales bacterium]